MTSLRRRPTHDPFARPRRARRLVSIVLGTTLVAAALGMTGASAHSTGTGSSAKAAPIKFMVIAGDSNGELSEPPYPAAQAAAKALNAAAGKNGRRYKVLTCESRNSNEVQQCARDAVEQDVVAIVGSFTIDDSLIPILEEANIPVIAPQPTGFLFFTSEISFPLTGGPAAVAGLGTVLADNGIDKIAVAGTTGLASAEIANVFIDRGIEEAGATKAGDTVTVPIGTPDVSAQVAELADTGAKGVAVGLTTDETIKLLIAAKQADYTPRFAVPAALLTPDDLDELGTAANGTYAVSFFRPVTAKNPEITRFKREMKKYAKDAPLTEVAVNAWLGVQVLHDVVADLDTVDAASVLAAMGQIQDLDLGFMPPFTTTQAGPLDGLPQVFNPFVYFNTIKNGSLFELSPEPVNPLPNGL